MFKSLFKRSSEPSPTERAKARLVEAEAWFGGALEGIQETALEAGPTGSPAWDDLLRSLGLHPASDEVRRSDAQDGFAQRRGAPLGEFNQAVAALCERAEAVYWDIHHVDPFLPELSEFRTRVVHEPEHAAERYAGLVKPRASLQDVFATALNSSVRHGERAQKRGLKTLRCKGCGAPRSDESDTQCKHCREAFFR